MFVDAAPRFVDQRDYRRHIPGRPRSCRQFSARCQGIFCATDQRNDAIYIGDRDGEPNQYVGPVTGLAEFEDRAPGDDFLAELDERGDDALDIEKFRLAAVERQHVNSERGLQRRVAKQLGEHHLRLGLALQLDHHSQAVPVGLVTQIADALDDLVVGDFGDALNHPRLVHLVGDFGDDDRAAIIGNILEMGTRAHQHRAAAGVEGRANAAGADDKTAGGKIRPLHVLQYFVDRNLRIVHIGAAGVDYLA